MEENTNESNQIIGVILACLLGIVASIGWAFIVQITGYSIGFAAVGVGYIVSLGFVWVGKSESSKWGVIAAVIAAISILIGKILVVIFSVTAYYEISFFEMVPIIDYKQLAIFIVEFFEPFDLVFYAVAIHTAYNRSFIKVSRSYSDYLNPKVNVNQQLATASDRSYYSDEGE